MDSDTAKDLRGSKAGEEVVSSTADLAAFMDAGLVILAVALVTAEDAMIVVGVYGMKS